MSAAETVMIQAVERIPGFLFPVACAGTMALLRHQMACGWHGGLLEIGVFQGKYFSVLARSAQDSGDRLLGIDNFMYAPADIGLGGARRTSRTRATPRSRSGAAARARSRRTAIEGELGAAVRFAGIDGSHAAADVADDLALAEHVLARHGILAIGRLSSIRARLGLAKRRISFSAHVPHLRPFALFGNKLFVARAALCREPIATWSKSSYAGRSCLKARATATLRCARCRPGRAASLGHAPCRHVGSTNGCERRMPLTIIGARDANVLDVDPHTIDALTGTIVFDGVGNTLLHRGAVRGGGFDGTPRRRCSRAYRRRVQRRLSGDPCSSRRRPRDRHRMCVQRSCPPAGTRAGTHRARAPVSHRRPTSWSRRATCIRCSRGSSRIRLNPAADVTIGDRVWLGFRAFVGKGAAIGGGSVIGAGAVVTGTIPAHTRWRQACLHGFSNATSIGRSISFKPDAAGGPVGDDSSRCRQKRSRRCVRSACRPIIRRAS